MIHRVIKRDGRREEFDPSRIERAIEKAIKAVGEKKAKAEVLRAKVVRLLEEKGKDPVGVEEIQDTVEEVLMKEGLSEVARAYILYRAKRKTLRESKSFLGVKDDLKLSLNAIQILRRRYLLRTEEGKIIETPSEMLERVSRHIAEAEKEFGGDPVKREEEFFTVMKNLKFLPNSPTLMNAGTSLGQLSACFVLPVEDSMEGIFQALKYMAIIHQSGGGTGFSFSRLRPKGDVVKSTGGIASGPVSFMKIFDTATAVIKQGGRRRGANMGILSVHHPDILEFITAKDQEGVLENFNLSVAVTDLFMEAYYKGEEYPLINPRTGKEVRKLSAEEVLDLIAYQAWKRGDPGIVWIDEINRHNPTPELGRIEATNPCGEQPLLPYESCNLGSINLARLVRREEINWEELRNLVHIGVNFLDNVIEVNRYPLPEVRKITLLNRKIGLGVMGFAELLIKLRIPYDSEEAEKLAEKIMKFIREEAIKKSQELAEKRGPFPEFPRSIWKKKGYAPLRNATLTTIAPTGTLSIIAGTTSGIEPLFGLVYRREILEGQDFLEVEEEFLRVAREKGFYTSRILEEVCREGSLQKIKGIPEDIKRIFVTSLDIPPEWHIRIQAAFQKYTDNAVSKTINFPPSATPQKIKEALLLSHKLKCKGITVYRYGSKREQVLYRGNISRARFEPEFKHLFLHQGEESCPICEG